MHRKEFYFPSSDGDNRIYTVIWMPDKESYACPKGIVQISHGMVEYAGRYEELAASLTARGFLVAGNDHLGHGRSVRSTEDWGHIDAANGSACMVNDLHRLTKILKKRFPQCPYFLLGHSMWSFLARRYLMTYGGELDGAVLLGTGNHGAAAALAGLLLAEFMAAYRGTRYRSTLLRKLMFGSYNRRIRHPESANDWVCSDRNVMEAYNSDPACTFVFTASGVAALMKTLLFIGKRTNIGHIPKNMPILMASGREDPVGNYGKAVEKVFRIYRRAGIEDITVRLFDRCRHELHNEVGREAVHALIGDWLEEKAEIRQKYQ